MRLTLALSLTLGLVLALGVQAQPTPSPRPAQVGPYPTPIYRMNEVGKTLNLDAKQIDRLNQMTDQLQTRYREDFDKLGTLKDADRTTRMQELNQRYNTDWMKGARDVFNENQLNRYQQLQYQYGGFNSFNNPDVQKRLNLSDEQRRNLPESINWSAQQYQDINRLAATDREKAMQQYRDYQKQYQERVNKFLTPEQQKTWREITGEPFTFTPTFPPARP